MTATKTSTSNTATTGPKIRSAEPRGWGKRQLIADLHFEKPEEGGPAVMISDPVEDGTDTQVCFYVERVPVENGSSRPPFELGYYEQLTNGDWAAEPIRVCGLFPPRDEAVEKAKKKGYALPFVSGAHQDVKHMELDDPENRRWEIWRDVDPDGNEIAVSKLYARMRATAEDLPEVETEEDFWGL